MRSAAFAFAMALLTAVALTPLVRRFAVRVGAVDAPGERRVNVRRIPRLGGLAVVVAFFIPLLMLFAMDARVATVLFSDPWRIVGLTVGSGMVISLGAIDDIRGVRARNKLLVQVAAAVLAYYCGFRIDAIALPMLGNLQMGVFALPVTVFWIVAIINALNLIDGLDGLAAGVAFFVCVTNFVVATLNDPQAPLVMLGSACLGGAILGFLLYNFNPASIFMGDTGSMFLGFILATLSMLGSAVKSSTTVAMLVPLVALGLPIIDTLFAMVRRYLERRPIFSPDKGHIHHRMLQVGITHRRAVLILYAICVLLTLGAIAISLGRDWQVGGAVVILSVVVFGVVRFAGYFEQWKSKRSHEKKLHSPIISGMRTAIRTHLPKMAKCESFDELKAVLLSLAEDGGMLEATFAAGDHPLARPFDWSRRPSTPAPGPREVVSNRFTLGPDGRLSLRFVWPGEFSGPSPEMIVLLEMVREEFDAQLLRLLQRPMEVSAKPPEQAPPQDMGAG